MKSEFWQDRWKEKWPGWLQKRTNPRLEQFFPQVALQNAGGVFVPLCGNSKDMLWLSQQGFPVTGVELVREPVERFFREAEWAVSPEPIRSFQRWQNDDFTIWQGNLFDLRPDDLAGITLIYDRASLPALDPETRKKYVRQLTQLFPAGTRCLLLVADFHSNTLSGPPFSMRLKDVQELYGKDWQVALLIEEEVPVIRGLKDQVEGTILETVCLLERLG